MCPTAVDPTIKSVRFLRRALRRLEAGSDRRRIPPSSRPIRRIQWLGLPSRATTSSSAALTTSPAGKRSRPATGYFSPPVLIGSDHLTASTTSSGRHDNRVSSALRRSQSLGRSLKSFILAVNLQVPGRDCHSAVFYFAADDPIPPDSLLHRFIHGDDAFRNSRFKIVNRIVKGPWIVKAAVGNYAACLLGKALQCNYYKGANYLEIDVDIGSSAIASAVLKLALGYVTSVTIDMGFVVEAQAEEELPEKLIGAVRIAQMEMSAAQYVEPTKGRVVPAEGPAMEPRRGGPTRVAQERDEAVEG
ncbi:hypothetical protein KSP40_PGU018572 [Platanthera guangdongensis]|uniref:Protein ENHANCED DISEASE RESISTANCE 2 C-terminal domain-containing protein n=1 Tax=Platanthera guangdongensis TaxID=2320717 RepID=A0ABR2MUF7_9ASPA